MDKSDAIKFCRYYHGEDVCPFRDEERATLWKIERAWAERMIAVNTEMIEEAVSEYVAYGLGEFQMRDGVPISLKAFLFNRLTKYDERIDLEAFRQFYLKYYK